MITGLNVGGAESVLLSLLAHLQAIGVQQSVFVLLKEGPLTPRIRELGIECRHLGLNRGSISLSVLSELNAVVSRFQPAIVHGWMYHACLCAGAAVQNLPVLWSIHHASLSFSANTLSTLAAATLCGLLSWRSNISIAYCAQSALSEHARHGYCTRRASFIPNGYSRLQFSRNVSARERFRAQLNISPDAVVVGMVARFDPIKDHESFFTAAGIVSRRTSSAPVFLLFGDGIDESNSVLMNMIARNGLANVILGGRCNDMVSAYSAMDLLVLSSKSEAFPNVLCEAMLCGLPCVATRVGDCEAIVGPCGFTAPPHSPRQLADALYSALLLPEDARLEMGSVARRRIESSYSEERFFSGYKAAYSALVGGPGVPARGEPLL